MVIRPAALSSTLNRRDQTGSQLLWIRIRRHNNRPQPRDRLGAGQQHRSVPLYSVRLHCGEIGARLEVAALKEANLIVLIDTVPTRDWHAILVGLEPRLIEADLAVIDPADQDTTAHTTGLRNDHCGQLHGRSAPVGCVHSVPEPQRVAHPVACKYEYIGQPGFDHRVKAEVFIRSARIARRFLLADEVAYDQ